MRKYFRTLKFKPEISPGICPYCEEPSSFISIVNDLYRCMNCGFDVEQKINGVIKYLPVSDGIKLEHEPKES